MEQHNEEEEEEEEEEEFWPRTVESEARRVPDVSNGGEDEEELERIGKSGQGGRMRNIGDPRLPSRKEVEEYHLTHVPNRNCCPRGAGPLGSSGGGSQNHWCDCGHFWAT